MLNIKYKKLKIVLLDSPKKSLCNKVFKSKKKKIQNKIL